MATTNTYTGAINGSWTSGTEWSDGVPAPGETDIITGTNVSTGDLGLFDQTVQLISADIFGNVLALADSSIVSPEDMGAVLQQEIIADRMSFVGIPATNTNGGFTIQTSVYINQGTIGAEGGGSEFGGLVLYGQDSQGGLQETALVNQGQIIASGAGIAYLNANVTGSGSISISDGGTLHLGAHFQLASGQGSIAATQKVNMGGQDATTLAFDPSVSSISAKIAGFDLTDMIDLQNFQGFFTQSGTKNPTLTFTQVVTGVPLGSFTLSFSGNYKGDTFSLAPDASGHGTLLLVT